jgi:hypothetical protein
MRNVARIIGSLAVLWASGTFASETRPVRPEVGVAPPKRIPSPVAAPSAPAGQPVAMAAIPASVRRAVVMDAARRFQVAESAVVLARAEKVTWSDGSLGCPQSGRMYTQALVPGFRLIAKTADGELEYHTDMRGNLVGCAQIPGQSRMKR